MVLSPQTNLINRLLELNDWSLMHPTGLSREDFNHQTDIFDYLKDFQKEYGRLPTKHSLQEKFPQFQIVDMDGEDINFLADKVKEQNNFEKLAMLVEMANKLSKQDSFEAVAFLQSEIRRLETSTKIRTVDIAGQADIRLTEYQKRLANPDHYFIPTGLAELDDILGGWQRGEELVTIYARTNEGKSFFLVKTMMEAWRNGNNVGFISPEMTANSIGYRFDTVYRNFSNTSLLRGRELEDYEDYIQELKSSQHSFFVSTPEDFGKRVTVSKLRSFCLENKIDILGIDGINGLTDERAQKGDTKTIRLTNISEDLMTLSLELSIPILVVTQANRDATKSEGKVPALENISDSDGIGRNATKAISLRLRGNALEVAVTKNRNGEKDGLVIYEFFPDTGLYRYVPSFQDGTDQEYKEKAIKELKDIYEDSEVPF